METDRAVESQRTGRSEEEITNSHELQIGRHDPCAERGDSQAPAPAGRWTWKFSTALTVLIFLFVAQVAATAMGQQDHTKLKSSAAASASNSTSDGPSAATAQSKIHIQTTIVNAPATVMDKSGNFVQDLKESDFEIIDDGVPQKIERFGLATEPVALVIVVQNSQAVAPLLDQVRPLGSIFSNLILGATGRAAVVFFDNQVKIAQNFARQEEVLAKTLSSVQPDGAKARLNDALMQAIAMLSSRPVAERRVVIALSEGFDRGSRNRPQDVIHAAMAAGVAIYGLQFSAMQALLRRQDQPRQPNPLDTAMARPTPGEQPHTVTASQNYYDTPDIPVIPIVTESGDVIRSAAAKSLLQAYAGYTGGVDYSHWSKKTLQKQLTQVALEINSQYELAYAPSTLNQTGFHRLQIEVKLPSFKVRARSGYYNLAKKK
ncbi:MAG: VWA domain-containing protein [Terriglobia bacterium]